MNEDSVAAVECDGRWLFVLADGLGGHGHGEVASAIVTDTARTVITQSAGESGQLDELIGVNCGIMDQFASAMGRQGHALLLDTFTLGVEYAPIDQSRVSVVIVNSGVKHSLASSAYNTRRRECETALANICEQKKIPSLCSLIPSRSKTYPLIR